MIKNTKKSANGTSFFGTTIETTPSKLIELFPNTCKRNFEKTNFDFILENSDGDVFTIYDWKQPLSDINEIITFNIGGNSKEITKKSKQELLILL